MRPGVSTLLNQLDTIRTRFGRAIARRRLQLLRHMSAQPTARPADLTRYHDLLLFHAAYPDSSRVLRAIQAELRRVTKHARKHASALDDSGIANTESFVSLSIDAIDWLDRYVGRDVRIAWNYGSAGDGLDDVLPLLMSPIERDGFLTDALSTRDWLAAAAGRNRRSQLRWLVDRFADRIASAEVRDRVFEIAEIPLRWRLRSNCSRTWARFPPRAIHFQVEPPVRTILVADQLARPLPPPRRLTAAAARALIDTARATLYVRERETDAVTYANPTDVSLFSLERGIDVALFGAVPSRRLPVESFVGFVVARNRVPIGYGGGWLFVDRSEIGINVFDSFRGGESAYAFAQIMRVYHQRFGARRFVVDPFQFGADNAEGIQSGAFWFYYRLGFRPVDRRLRERADAEAARIAAGRRYRTRPAILRRLAQTKLSLDADGTGGWHDQTPNLHRLGQFVTRARARVSQQSSSRWASIVARRLGIRGTRAWPAAEREAFENLCPLVAQIDGLTRWPASDRASLIALMRIKGRPRQIEFIRALQQHERLRLALQQIAANR